MCQTIPVQFFQVVNSAEQQPLAVHLEFAPEIEPVEPEHMPYVGKNRLNCAYAF